MEKENKNRTIKKEIVLSRFFRKPNDENVVVQHEEAVKKYHEIISRRNKQQQTTATITCDETNSIIKSTSGDVHDLFHQIVVCDSSDTNSVSDEEIPAEVKSVPMEPLQSFEVKEGTDKPIIPSEACHQQSYDVSGKDNLNETKKTAHFDDEEDNLFLSIPEPIGGQMDLSISEATIGHQMDEMDDEMFLSIQF